MKLSKKILACLVMIFMIIAWLPVSSFAVDPVSASVMANAFAQAITAYGAAQGVSMTFDVSNAAGIGDGVHELWDQYQDDMSNSNITVSDFQSLAASAFPNLWSKTFQYITVNLDAATRGEIDGFWNWLLSGPAEMQKVDDQYYEWTINQNNSVDPISVLSFVGYPVAVIPNASNDYSTYSSSSKVFSDSGHTVGILATQSCVATYFAYPYDPSAYTFAIISTTQLANTSFQYITYFQGNYYGIGNNYVVGGNLDATYNVYVYTSGIAGTTNIEAFYCPVYSSLQDGIAASAADILSPSGISVRPYIGDTAPQNVYIPDNTDVNYEPEAVTIPIDVTWDDSLFGDGTGALTDAESEAITDAVSGAITDSLNQTLELADTTNPPAVPGVDTFNSVLPFSHLPSFNFNLSGIWYYVTAWVSSISSWLSAILVCWSHLPAAISLPVYASAVIVIVLGVYRRFFM